MRIAMMIEAWKPVWAGGQIHVWVLCQGLVAKHNCEVDLFVMNIIEDCPLPKTEEYFGGKLRIFRVGKLCQPNFLSRLKWCWEVVKLVQKKNKEKPYDLIHAHANLPGLPGKILRWKLGIPITFTVHGSGLQAIKDMYGSGLKSEIIYYTEKFLQTKIKYDGQITVDSSFLKYENVNKNIMVIPNGVNVNAFDKIKAHKSKRFKIIYVGRLHPQKGLVYLLEALSLIKDQLSNVEVHIIGSGELEQELKQKTKKWNLEKIVLVRGKIYGEELIREYKSSHLFVLPSLYEGQPLTLLEAWAAKLPVLVTDVGGNRDFVVDGENGYIIPAKDGNALAQALLMAISPEKREKILVMGKNGYQLVKENYSWKKMVENTANLYQSVLTKKRNNLR